MNLLTVHRVDSLGSFAAHARLVIGKPVITTNTGESKSKEILWISISHVSDSSSNTLRQNEWNNTSASNYQKRKEAEANSNLES